MKRCQAMAGRLLPEAFLVGLPSSLPNQTPAVERRRCSRRTRRRGNPGWCRSCRPPASRRSRALRPVPRVERLAPAWRSSCRHRPGRPPARARSRRARRAPCRSAVVMRLMTCGMTPRAAIGEGHEGAGQLERASPPRCRARSTASPCSGEAMPSRRAVAATAAGPTSAVSCDRHRVERQRQRRLQRHRAEIFARVVLRRPAVDRDRLVDADRSPASGRASSAVR